MFKYHKRTGNKHIQASTIRHRFRKMRRKLGMTQVYYTCTDGKKLYRVTPHTLRHYVTWKLYVSSGKCLVTTRDIIGHVELKTTAKYCRSLDAVHNERSIIENAFTNTNTSPSPPVNYVNA